jgi:hypothetical protein
MTDRAVGTTPVAAEVLLLTEGAMPPWSVLSIVEQIPEVPSIVVGTRMTGLPPFSYEMSTVPPLPITYWVQEMMLRRPESCQTRHLRLQKTYSVVAVATANGVYVPIDTD